MRRKPHFDIITSIRLDDETRERAEEAAHTMGMTFSQFARQSIIRNIQVAMDIEKQLNERNSRMARGLPIHA